MTFSDQDRNILLDVARKSIAHGLKHLKPLTLKLETYPVSLQQLQACFVTLEIQKKLRGCIGSLEAHQPLIVDVSHNAHAAAFGDPRFPHLSTTEFLLIEIHISVLTPPEPMQFTSEEDLLRQLKPGVDGLILADGGCRGTFLPTVWEQLPEPILFLQHLKNKAGLPNEHWSNTIQVHRYTTEIFGG